MVVGGEPRSLGKGGVGDRIWNGSWRRIVVHRKDQRGKEKSALANREHKFSVDLLIKCCRRFAFLCLPLLETLGDGVRPLFLAVTDSLLFSEWDIG